MKDYLEKRRAELKKRGNKGFTLMEMLIVVAIIAVLIAIAIPIFTSQLERANQATDASNIRSAYAEANVKALESGGNGSAESAPMKHTGTFDKIDDPKIGKENISSLSVTKDKTVTVSVDKDGNVTITANS